jgi:hypothetical protein
VNSTLKRSVAVAAALSVASALCSSIAGADEAAAVHTLGGQAELVNGNVVQGWTIRDLKPSADAIPHSAAGTVWEATASDTAIQGTVIPVVSNLNARARDGETYPVLFAVATPQGVNPATLGQGQTTSGKVYFDVTGAAPDSVTYSAGGNDLIVWVQPPPATAATGPGSPQGRHPAPRWSALPLRRARQPLPPATRPRRRSVRAPRSLRRAPRPREAWEPHCKQAPRTRHCRPGPPRPLPPRVLAAWEHRCSRPTPKAPRSGRSPRRPPSRQQPRSQRA